MQAKLADRIKPLLRQAKVRRAGLFGSMARGEDRPNSDVDILVELSPEAGLLEFVNLKRKLEEIFGRRVDMVEYDALKPALRQKILEQQVALL